MAGAKNSRSRAAGMRVGSRRRRSGTVRASQAVAGDRAPARERGNTRRDRDERTLRVGFVPGVHPDVFARRWSGDPMRAALVLTPLTHLEQVNALCEEAVDMVFARLPLAWPDAGVPTGEHDVHTVRLWQDVMVAVVAREHELAREAELSHKDLDGLHEWGPARFDDERERVEMVATGVGYALMPMSLARLHHRKDVVMRPVVDVPASHIALVWPKSRDDELRQEFVAVVRGRTVRSGRG